MPAVIEFKDHTESPENQLAFRLQELPHLIKQAAILAWDHNQSVIQEKRVLQEAEDRLLLTPGALLGKNEEIRKAEIRDKTAFEISRLQVVEYNAKIAAIQLTALENEFSALKAVARLMAANMERSER